MFVYTVYRACGKHVWFIQDDFWILAFFRTFVVQRYKRQDLMKLFGYRFITMSQQLHVMA